MNSPVYIVISSILLIGCSNSEAKKPVQKINEGLLCEQIIENYQGSVELLQEHTEFIAKVSGALSEIQIIESTVNIETINNGTYFNEILSRLDQVIDEVNEGELKYAGLINQNNSLRKSIQSLRSTINKKVTMIIDLEKKVGALKDEKGDLMMVLNEIKNKNVLLFENNEKLSSKVSHLNIELNRKYYLLIGRKIRGTIKEWDGNTISIPAKAKRIDVLTAERGFHINSIKRSSSILFIDNRELFWANSQIAVIYIR